MISLTPKTKAIQRRMRGPRPQVRRMRVRPQAAVLLLLEVLAAHLPEANLPEAERQPLDKGLAEQAEEREQREVAVDERHGSQTPGRYP